MPLSEETLRAIQDMGFAEATPIQAETIEYALEGQDLIGQSQTGTGKTLAFAVPCIEQIDPFDRSLQTVVLCPTRELCMQVCEEFRLLLKYHENIKVVPVYGGQPIDKQIHALRGGAQVVVGTPGRFMDHMRRHTLRLKDVVVAVLDEADEMLDMGFREDIELILSQMPKERQTLLFSATMPEEIRQLAGNYLEEPKFVKTVDGTLTVPKIDEYYFDVKEKMKVEALCRLLDMEEPELTLVFCNTKKRADDLTRRLKERGYSAEVLHGDLSQAQRDSVMKRFRSRALRLLVATDVASRGLDIENIDLVVNFDLPDHEEYYVHRIGRTGRAGQAGRAYTFVVGHEMNRLRDIMRYTGGTIKPGRLPTLTELEAKRSAAFLEEIRNLVREGELSRYKRLVEQLTGEGFDPADIAAALLRRELGDTEQTDDLTAPPRPGGREYAESDMVRLRISAGSRQQIRAKDILGAIAGEAGIPGRVIGSIQIMEDYSLVDVPNDFARDVLTLMRNCKIKGRPVQIRRDTPNEGRNPESRNKRPKAGIKGRKPE